MSAEIVFYHNPFSRGRIARLMLEEIGAPYRTVLVNFENREHKEPAYLALNPMGKIPTIVHGDVVVTEAAAICAYLADAFPDRGLAPALDDPARGTYLRWLFFGAGCVEPALSDKILDRPSGDRPQQLPYGTFEDTMNTLERALQPGPFLLGERYTAADVYISSQINWGIFAKALATRPVFESYLDKVRQRPASKRAVAADDELGEILKSGD